MKVVDEAISRWINKLFGGLIEPVTPESINVSAREGRAQLENLTIRPSCMAELGLPVVLNAGTVGSLQIDIPMRSLRAKPVRVAIRDVLISLSPNPSTNVKKAQLEKHLLERRQAQLDRDAELDPNSKLGRIFAKVADNFILTVENVHFRFEDTLSRQPSWGIETHPERCFSLGVTLDKFELRGVVLGADGEWEPRCIKDQQRFMNKTVVIGSATSRTADERGERALRLTHPYGLGIYLQHGERPLGSDDMRKWKADMRGYIAAADDPTDNDWIFGPMSVACKVSVDTEAARRKPSSSRIWGTQQLPAVARTSWMQEELTKNNVVAVAVRVTSAQILAAGQHQTLRVCWAFETEKDATAFEVLHFADPTDSAYRALQAAAVVECQNERARGDSVAESGVLLLRWTNAGAKRRATSVRYTLWMESENNTGERDAEPLPCNTMMAAELSEFLQSTGLPKPTVSRNGTQDALGADSDEQGWTGEKDNGAQTELDVRTGRVQINLHHRTLLNLIAMQNWYSNVERWRQVSSLRPTLDDGMRTSALEAPRAWWQFAINAVIEFLPSHIFKMKLRMYIDGALEYDALFKRKYSNAEYAAGRGEGRPWHQPLREHEHARLEKLEEILPMEMVLGRREAVWCELIDDEKHDEVRRRDVVEAEASLLGVAAERWTAPPEGDRVLQSNWAHFEGAKGKPKRHWFVLADVMSQQPTRFSGWLYMRELLPETDEASLPKTGVRLWYRLKGAALSWYTDASEKTKPAGMIGISVIEEARQIPGSADTFELVIGSAGRRIQLTCDTFKELKHWLASMDGALSNVRVREEGDRWLLVYSKPTDSKATEVLPLKQWSYTLDPPRKAKKGLQHSHELSIALADSSVQKCLIGCTAEDEEGFLGLMAHLESDVAETILGTSERVVKRSESAQSADGEDEDEDEDEDDSELDPRTTEGRSSLSLSGAKEGGRSSSLLLQKIVLHVEQFSVSFGVRDSSWLSADLKQLELSTSLYEQGTTSLAATVQEIQVEDLYTRDSSHPHLLCRLAGDALGCEDDPMFRLLFKTAYRQSEPTDPAASATSSAALGSPETSTTTSSTASAGSVDDLKFDFSPEPEGQLETYVQAVMQPTQLVLNAHILPVMASFFALRGNEGFKKVGAKLSASATRLFSRFEQMTRPDMNASRMTSRADSEADRRNGPHINNPLTNMRVLLKLKGFEVVLADDLSIMRDDASSVVCRMESFQLAHADYRTPRSAVSAEGLANAEAGWSHRTYTSELEGIIPLEGHASKIEVFCCDRDDYSRNRQAILQPVTANISLCISSVGRGEHAEWLKLHVAVDTLDFHFSTQALMTLFKVLLSSSRLLELQYVSKALIKSKAMDATADGSRDTAHSAVASSASGTDSPVDGAERACGDDGAVASRVVATSELSGSAIVRAKVDVQKMLFTVELGGVANGSDGGDSVGAGHLQVEIVDLMVGMGLTASEVVTRYQVRHLNAFSTSAGKWHATTAAAAGPAAESGEADKGQIFAADLPFGLCHIVPTLDSGDTAAGEGQTAGNGSAGGGLGDSRWLYNTADPNKLVRFTTVKDLLQVTSPVSGREEIMQLFPLLTVAMRMATLKAGLGALAGGAAPAATLASTVWSGMDELQQQLQQQGHLGADGTKGSAALSRILGADLAEVGITVAKELLGDELWRSVVPTVRYVAAYADTTTTTANEKIQSRLGREASDTGDESARPGESAGQPVTISRSSNSVTIDFSGGAQAPGASSTRAATTMAVEAADFSGLGAAELELLCSSLGAAARGASERSKDELLQLLKAKLVEGR